MLYYIAFGLSSAIAASALSAPVSQVVHRSRLSAPPSFVRVGATPADQTIKLTFALKSNNVEGLQDVLMDVSDPASPKYGQYLDNDQVDAYLAPSQDASAALKNFLGLYYVNPAGTSSRAGDWVEVEVPVSKANEMLSAKYETYLHSESGKTAVRTLFYSLPSDLAPHVDAIFPTTSFETPIRSTVKNSPKLPTKLAPAPGSTSNCNNAITPDCIFAKYGYPRTALLNNTQTQNVIGVTGYVQEYAQRADLNMFLKNFRSDVTASSVKTSYISVDGGTDPQNSSQDDNEADLEANLDLQYTAGIASGIPNVFISDGYNGNDILPGFLHVAQTLSSSKAPPSVLTTSYGYDENEVDASMAVKVCNAYMALGTQGTSVLFASGDGGVDGGHATQSCTKFIPTFPGACPYITSVGATQGYSTESAASFSSGGFSNIFKMPSYQNASVAAYIKQIGTQYKGLYNASGRAFPDISAFGVDVTIIDSLQAEGVDGTSCSSPIFASFIGLVNDRLISKGKAKLGFLNPLLYSSAVNAFNDVTSGSNPGCNTQGFSALKGWDPVTGLGTPNWSKFASVVGI